MTNGSKEKLVVVGANSFLAQAIIRKNSDKFEIVQIYNKSRDKLDPEHQQYKIDHFLKKKIAPHVIFFISSVINFKEDLNSIENIFSTNVLLLKRISELFPGSKLILASSVSVFEKSNKVLFESSRVNPDSSYGLSKLWAEKIVEQHPGGGVSIRISSLFGKGMNTSTFLPSIIIQSLKNDKIILYGDGSRMQNYIHVDEAAEYFIHAINYKCSGTLLAVNENSYSNIEIARMVQKILNTSAIIFKGRDTSSSFIYDNSFSKNELGINEKTTFQKKLENTILWIQKLS